MERETVLRQALEAGIDVLRAQYGDAYDPSFARNSIPELIETMWPYFEGVHERTVVRKFEEMFHERFPNHVLTNYGGSIFEYVVGNVQTAVANEIILMMQTYEQTMADASKIPRFANTHEQKRDWEVARAHTQELISEVRQYRTRGPRGPHITHTGTQPINLEEPTRD